MKRGEAPGRRVKPGPDLLRTVGGILLATCTIMYLFITAPPRKRSRRVMAAVESPAGPAAPRSLTFETLGAFDPRDVPPAVRALDGQVVRIEGFVMPVKMNGKHLAAFMLMSFVPDCCFAKEPRVNDWVMVGVPAELALSPSGLDYAVVTGRLQVKPVKDATGELAGLFALHASTVTPADGPAVH